MGGEIIPVIAIVSVFSYMAWKRYLDYQQRMETLRRGIDPKAAEAELEPSVEGGKPARVKSPLSPPDHRLSSMVWIALGIAFMVAGFMSAGMTKGVERGIAVGIWGLVPLAVGLGRFAYFTTEKDAEDCQLRSSYTLMAIGVSFVVCVTVSTGMVKGVERALAVGVWGLVPFSIGVVIYLYRRMVRNEQTGKGG